MHKNELYLVSYLSGCSGTFLQDILIQFVHDRCNESVNHVDKINAHNSNLITYNRSFGWKNKENPFLCYRNNNGLDNHDPDQSLIDQIVPYYSNPIVVSDHHLFEWDRLYQNFPNAKNILIQLDYKSYYRRETNIYYKICLEAFKADPESEFSEMYRNNLIEAHPDIANYPIDNIPVNSLIIAIGKILQRQIRPKYTERLGIFHSSYKIPKEYTDKVLAINYYDMITNKDKVLNKISEFIGYPIKPCITKTYDSYLLQQSLLFPWLDHR